MEQYFQDVTQKVKHDKNSESFAAHFDKKITQKTSPKQISLVKPIGSMKTWVKLSCTLCIK